MSGSTSDSALYKEWKQMVASDGKWLFWLSFLFCKLREERASMQLKENSLNLEEDLEEEPLN